MPRSSGQYPKEATFTGSRKAHILNNPGAKYCKYCDNTVCTVSHILTGCPIAKKAQISRHDAICKQVYYAVYRKYKEFDNGIWPIHIPKCTMLSEPNVTILYNKEVMPRSSGQYPKRPDVYVEVNNEVAYIFDVSIVKDERLRATYSEKMGKYQELAQKLHDEKKLTKSYIVPIIISTNGLISSYTAKRLIDLEINIKWPPIIRELLITQMKDLMFYLNQNIDRVELGQENPSNSARQESQPGGVSQDVSSQTSS